VPFDFPDSTHQTCMAVTALPNQDLATAQRILGENFCSFSLPQFCHSNCQESSSTCARLFFENPPKFNLNDVNKSDFFHPKKLHEKELWRKMPETIQLCVKLAAKKVTLAISFFLYQVAHFEISRQRRLAGKKRLLFRK
jgi:hypothetical protein